MHKELNKGLYKNIEFLSKRKRKKRLDVGRKQKDSDRERKGKEEKRKGETKKERKSIKRKKGEREEKERERIWQKRERQSVKKARGKNGEIEEKNDKKGRIKKRGRGQRSFQHLITVILNYEKLLDFFLYFIHFILY